MPDTIKLPEDVERRLKEWSENPDTGLCADFTTDGYAYYEELKIFLADELAKARAEGARDQQKKILQAYKINPKMVIALMEKTSLD